MAYYAHLLNMLVAAPQRVSAIGEINLSATEAELLRASGFFQAAAGRHRLPPIPASVPVPEYLFRVVPGLVRETPTIAPTSSPAPAPPPGPRYRRTSASVPSLALSASPGVRARQLRSWWHRASDAQRGVLKSILNAGDGRIRRRRLRKSQRRHPAPAFNTALDALLAAKIVTLERSSGARAGSS